VEFSNGVAVLSRANFNSPSVVISGFLPAGALFDPDEKMGLADFTAAALMRGSENRDFQQIYETLESAGASLGIISATHTVGFRGKALAEDLGMLLTLLAEVLRRPVFPVEQVERLRAQLLTGLAIRDQDTDDRAAMAFDQIVYRDHPYSRPESGYSKTISVIQAADLAYFHKTHYGPHGLAIAIVGGIDPQQAVAASNQAFGDWENPEQENAPELPPVKPLQNTIQQEICIPGKSQANIYIGAAGPARKSKDFFAAALGNSILGQFGMMGRLGETVREKAGLAYHVASSLSGGVGPGPWYVSAGVDPQNTSQTIDLIRAEIKRFTSEPVDQDELSDSQDSFIGRLPLSLESNGGVAAALTNLERYQLPPDYYCRYPDHVQGVSVEDVLQTACRYLDPEQLAIAVAGPNTILKEAG
jgi:zinc protease